MEVAEPSGHVAPRGADAASIAAVHHGDLMPNLTDHEPDIRP